MKLYGFPPSPNTRKVQAVAAHLNMPLEFEFVDITQGKSHTPEFLKMNPTGRTPVFTHGARYASNERDRAVPGQSATE
jgi:glutathione S-transferase